MPDEFVVSGWKGKQAGALGGRQQTAARHGQSSVLRYWYSPILQVWETHRTGITRRYTAGQKPSVVAAWLNTLGFIGSGATPNGYIRRI